MSIQRDLAAMARQSMPEAMDIALQILRDPEAKDADRIKVIEFLADRGYGKAAQAVIAVPVNRQMAQRLFSMSDADLLAILDAPAEPIDITPTDVTPADATPLLASSTDPLLL